MATYHLHVAEVQPNFAGRIRSSLRFTVLWLLGMLFIERIAHGYWGHPIVWIITGLICFLGGLLTSSLWPREPQSLDFQIDDFGIRSFWNAKPLRKVRSSRVRYVAERRGVWGTKLVVSEDNSLLKLRFSASCISIPKRLVKAEEYDQIKAMAFSWLPNSER